MVLIIISVYSASLYVSSSLLLSSCTGWRQIHFHVSKRLPSKSLVSKMLWESQQLFHLLLRQQHLCPTALHLWIFPQVWKISHHHPLPPWLMLLCQRLTIRTVQWIARIGRKNKGKEEKNKEKEYIKLYYNNNIKRGEKHLFAFFEWCILRDMEWSGGGEN